MSKVWATTSNMDASLHVRFADDIFMFPISLKNVGQVIDSMSCDFTMITLFCPIRPITLQRKRAGRNRSMTCLLRWLGLWKAISGQTSHKRP